MRRVALILTALLVALGPAGAAAAAPARVGTGTPDAVPRLTDHRTPDAAPRLIDTGTAGDEVGPVSCWSAGNCLATASGDARTAAAILLIHDGHVAGRETVVSQDTHGYVTIDGASCPTATSCWLSGQIVAKATLDSVGWIAAVVDGKLSREQVFSQMDDVGAISCSRDGDCLAVGGRQRPDATPRNSTGFLISLAGGVVRRISGLGAIDPTAMSCVASACLVVGEHPFTQVGASVAVDHGVPGKVISLPFGPYTVACTSASDCLVAGAHLDTVSDTDTDDLATVEHGRYAAPRPIPVYLSQLACTSATSCFGTATDTGAGPGAPEGGLVRLTHGVPGALQPVPGVLTLAYLGCAGGACLADGTASTGHRGILYAF